MVIIIVKNSSFDVVLTVEMQATLCVNSSIWLLILFVPYW